jgi:hypothetical protein
MTIRINFSKEPTKTKQQELNIKGKEYGLLYCGDIYHNKKGAD